MNLYKEETSSSSRSSSSSLKVSKRPRRIIKHKPGNFVKDSARRATALRPRQMNLYKEETSESDSDSRSSIEDPVDPMMEITEADFAPEVPISILETVAEIIDKVIEGGRTPKKSGQRYVSTPPIQTPTKAVPVRIEDDLNLVIVNDLEKSPRIKTDKLTSADSSEQKTSPTEVLPKEERKRVYLHFSEPSQDTTPPADTEDSVEDQQELLSSTAEEYSESNLTLSKSETTSVGFSSEKRASRSLKRLETDLVEVADLSPAGKRRNSFEQAKRKKVQQPLRISLPLEVKISAIERVESGEALAVVSRDLDITITSLSAWLMRKAEIRSRWQQEQDGEILAAEKELAKEIPVHQKEEAEKELTNGASSNQKTDSSNLEKGEDRQNGSRKSFDETLVHQLLESSDSETESVKTPNDDSLQSDMAASLGLTRVTKDEEQMQEKDTKSDELTKNAFEPSKPLDPHQEHGSRASPEKEECGGKSETSNCEENEKEKKSNLPLADLFKSMKTAFAVKCPSHSGESKKSPGSKKSVDFLANSLMERAVAKSIDSTSFSPVCDPTSPPSVSPSSPSSLTTKPAALNLPSTPSTSTSEPELNTELEIQPLHNTANDEATSEPIHSEVNLQKPEPAPSSASNFSGQLEEPSEPIQTTPLPPLSSTANQAESLGLAMIGACYCSSSDDEL